MERQESTTGSDEGSSTSTSINEVKSTKTRQSRCTPSYESQYLSRKRLDQVDDDLTPKKAPGTVSMEKSRSRSRGLSINTKRNITNEITSETPKKATTKTVDHSKNLKSSDTAFNGTIRTRSRAKGNI